MKKKLYILIVFIVFGLISCEKSNDEIKIESLNDTKWKLTKVIDNNGKVSNFPSEIDDFEIIFRKNGTIDLPDYCNYSFGEY